MERKNNNPRMVYPMSMIGKFFTKEEVEKMSQTTQFDYENEYFHFDENCENPWIESIDDADIKFYNDGMPKNQILLKVA